MTTGFGFGAGLAVYLAAGLVFGVICMLISVAKKQPAWIGFALGFFFSIAGLVAVLIMNGTSAQARRIPPPHPNSQWLTDPTGRHQYRLWDGQRWSGHVSDAGRAGFDPIG